MPLVTGVMQNHVSAEEWALEMETNLREVFTIMEKAPTRAFSKLKVPTSTFAFKKQAQAAESSHDIGIVSSVLVRC